MTTAIKINPETKEIIVARSFYKKATVFGTMEYDELKRAREKEPAFTVKVKEIARNRNKKTYPNLTFRNMARYIAIKEGSQSPNISKLHTLIDASDIQTSRYAFVKSWFLKNYPDYTDPDALLESISKEQNIQESANARTNRTGKTENPDKAA